MSTSTSSPKHHPIHMLPLRDVDTPTATSATAPPSTCIQPRSISKARSIRVKLSLRRSPIGLTNTLTIDTGFPSASLPLKHRPSLPLFSTTPLPAPTSASPTMPASPPRPAPRRGPLLQLQVTPPTPPKKRREELIQALRLGEEWRVGQNTISRAGSGPGVVGLEKWSAVKASGLNWGGAATVGRGAGRRGVVGAVGPGGLREGWF